MAKSCYREYTNTPTFKVYQYFDTKITVFTPHRKQLTKINVIPTCFYSNDIQITPMQMLSNSKYRHCTHHLVSGLYTYQGQHNQQTKTNKPHFALRKVAY